MPIMPVAQLDVLWIALQQARADQDELFLHTFGRTEHRAGDGDAEPAAAGPEVRWRRQAVL